MNPGGQDTRPFAVEIAEIQQASMVAFSGIGFTGAVGPDTAAYFALSAAIKGGADLGADLHRLVAQATPAGRIYAAELLEQADPAAAAEVWQALRSDRSEVQTGGGCIIDATTVADYAAGKQRAVS